MTEREIGMKVRRGGERKVAESLNTRYRKYHWETEGT